MTRHGRARDRSEVYGPERDDPRRPAVDAIIRQLERAGWPPTTGGVTDHGALTGLSDDDHTQYHNDTRGDARYPLITAGAFTTAAPTSDVAASTSNGLVRKGEMDTALAGKSDVGHTHTAAEVAVDDSGFSGPLAGESIASVKTLADWLDANLPIVLDRQYGNPVASVASTSYTTLLSVTIPENTLPTRSVRMTLIGDLLQNTGSSQRCDMRISLGGTAQVSNNGPSVTTSATRYLWKLVVTLTPRAVGAQMIHATFEGAGGFSSTAGISSFGTKNWDGVAGNNAVAKDETTALALLVETRYGTGTGGGSDIRLLHAYTEAF